MNKDGLKRSLEYFVDAPAGEPDVILGSIGAVIAQEACNRERCCISTTCNPYIADSDRYNRRARLASCSDCSSKIAISNTRGVPGDPGIVKVDDQAYLRGPALTALKEFWEVVDSSGYSSADVFLPDVRKAIARAITLSYIEPLN